MKLFYVLRKATAFSVLLVPVALSGILFLISGCTPQPPGNTPAPRNTQTTQRGKAQPTDADADSQKQRKQERLLKAKTATLAVWNELIRIGDDAQRVLGGKKITKELAAGCRGVGIRLSNLPALDVEPELMVVICKLSADVKDIAAVVQHISERQTASYQINKLAEAFSRGVMLDLGTTKEINEEIKKDNDKWDEIDERIRKSVAELNVLRVKFTAKYGMEFPVLSSWNH